MFRIHYISLLTELDLICRNSAINISLLKELRTLSLSRTNVNKKRPSPALKTASSLYLSVSSQRILGFAQNFIQSGRELIDEITVRV
jgi:hypothetical protein